MLQKLFKGGNTVCNCFWKDPAKLKTCGFYLFLKKLCVVYTLHNGFNNHLWNFKSNHWLQSLWWFGFVSKLVVESDEQYCTYDLVAMRVFLFSSKFLTLTSPFCALASKGSKMKPNILFLNMLIVRISCVFKRNVFLVQLHTVISSTVC